MEFISALYNAGVDANLHKKQYRFFSSQKCECVIRVDMPKKRPLQLSDFTCLKQDEQSVDMPMEPARSSDTNPPSVPGCDKDSYIFGESLHAPEKAWQKHFTSHSDALLELSESKKEIGPVAKKLYEFFSSKKNSTALFKQFEQTMPSKFTGRVLFKINDKDIFLLDGYMEWFEDYVRKFLIDDSTQRRVCPISHVEDFISDKGPKMKRGKGFAGLASANPTSHESFRQKTSATCIGLTTQEVALAAFSHLMSGRDDTPICGRRIFFNPDDDTDYLCFAPFGLGAKGKAKLITDFNNMVSGKLTPDEFSELKERYQQIAQSMSAAMRAISPRNHSELFFGKPRLENMASAAEIPIITVRLRFSKNGLEVHEYNLNSAAHLANNLIQWGDDLQIVLPIPQLYKINGTTHQRYSGNPSIPVGINALAASITKPQDKDTRKQLASEMFWMITTGDEASERLIKLMLIAFSSAMNSAGDRTWRVGNSLSMVAHMTLRRYLRARKEKSNGAIVVPQNTPTIEEWRGEKPIKGELRMAQFEEVPKEFDVECKNPFYCMGAAIVTFNRIHSLTLKSNTDFNAMFWSKMCNDYNAGMKDFQTRYLHISQEVKKSKNSWLRSELATLTKLLSTATVENAGSLKGLNANFLLVGMIQRQGYDEKCRQEHFRNKQRQEQGEKVETEVLEAVPVDVPQ